MLSFIHLTNAYQAPQIMGTMEKRKVSQRVDPAFWASSVGERGHVCNSLNYKLRRARTTEARTIRQIHSGVSLCTATVFPPTDYESDHQLGWKLP